MTIHPTRAAHPKRRLDSSFRWNDERGGGRLEERFEEDGLVAVGTGGDHVEGGADELFKAVLTPVE